MSNGPINDVSFGTAMQISLDSFYQVLKSQVGVAGSNQYLQLKTIADSIDISEADYPWYSTTNLYYRSDQAIVPSPTSDVVTATAVLLSSVYGQFLDTLMKYVAVANLSAADQAMVDSLKDKIGSLKQQNELWRQDDYKNWQAYADATGQSVGDTDAQLDWEQQSGHAEDIQQNQSQINILQYRVNKIYDTTYSEPGDKLIVQAYADFVNPGMYMGYPLKSDSQYDDHSKFSVEYLISMADSGRFLRRPVIAWDKSLQFMQNSASGAIAGIFDSSTQTTTSQSTDWGVTTSVSYLFISVSASASDHSSIQTDFSHATGLDISTNASYSVNLTFPDWFHPELFSCQRVKENIHDFAEFFGPKGSLLFYPIGLACVRGFKVVFHSSQTWTYDYAHSFSAKAGGGFSIFGIGFGGSGSYTNDQKEHTVSTSGTDLTVSDDPTTIRFVGYLLAKNTVYEDSIAASTPKLLKAAHSMINQMIGSKDSL